MMMRALVPIAWLTALCAGPAVGQEPGPEEALAPELVAALQAALDAGRAEIDARGASAAIIFPDGRRWTGASGVAHDTLAVVPETVFEAGSITKTFTAALVLQLSADGLVALDDVLARWVSTYPNAGGITIRQLLNHTSGLDDAMQNPRYVPAMIANPRRSWTADEVLELVADPHFEPGAGWRYSNAGYLLLGKVVEAATGRSAGDLMSERLFLPSGLSRTYFAASEYVPGPMAHAYVDINSDGQPEDLTDLMPNTSFLTSAWTAGAVVSTAADLATWIRALHTGAVLAPAQYAEMIRFVDRPDGNRYGQGVLRVELDSVVLHGHRGNSTGFSSAAWHAPDTGITVVVLTNTHGMQVTPIVRALLEATRRGMH
jgi:D-alanyl-D-alanine carboxypeptidase